MVNSEEKKFPIVKNITKIYFLTILKIYMYRKKIINLIGLIFIGCSQLCAFASTHENPIQEANNAGISSYKLRNGFKIILIPYETASNTRVELLIKSGSKFEGYGETGMAHLLEHMLFKGAGNRKNLKDDLTKIGADFNGTTTSDRTNYFETIEADSKKLNELIKLEADRFIRPRFTAKDLLSEMTVVRNELENSQSNTSRLVMDELSRNNFRWHGYSRPVIGEKNDIENATYKSLKAFHQKHYRPDNAVLIISGKFNKKQTLALASNLFSKARNPSLEMPSNWTEDPYVSMTKKSYLTSSAGKTVVASGWKLPSVRNREVHALDLGITAICDDSWGSLRNQIVIEKKLAAAASCYVSTDADYSRLIGYASAGKDANATLISNALTTHIQEEATRGVTTTQLERARLAELNSFKRLFESHEETANQISDFEVAGDWRLLFWSRDVVMSTTLEETNQALKKWIVDNNRADVLLSHSDVENLISYPAKPEPKQLIKNTLWPDITSKSDEPPKSYLELSEATKIIQLDGKNAQAAFITRNTLGDKVWLVMQSQYGNAQTLANKRPQCAAASSLMQYGGDGINRDELDEKLEKLEAIWRLGLTGITLEVPRQNLEAAFTTLYKVWSKPLIPVNEFQRYQASQIALHEANLRNPSKVADNQVRIRFDNFPEDHWAKPKTFETMLSDAKNLDYKEVKKCADDFAKPAYIRIGVVGKIQERDTKALWAATGGKDSTGITFERIASPIALKTVDTSLIKVEMPDVSSALVTGTAVVEIMKKSRDFAALQVAVEVIGGDSSSLIWKRLREDRGLAYSTGMSLSASDFDLRSTLQLHASSSNSNADKAMNELKLVLQTTYESGITTAQIKRVQDSWKQKQKNYLGVEKNFASVLASSLYDGDDFKAIAQLDEEISKLDAKEVTDAMHKYLNPNSFVWAIGKGLN